MGSKLVSYIFPIFNEAGNIPLLCRTVDELLTANSQYKYELIFVNDGSRDNSIDLLRDLQRRDPRVTVIDFSRNFGHQIAVTAGLDYAKGDAVIIMDADMQDPPRVSMELLAKWEDGYDVVYAQRRSRRDGVFKRLTAYMFYKLLRRVAEIDIPRNTGDFRLLDRRVVDELKKFGEHNRFLRGMVSYVGFRQAPVLFDRDERHAGTTGYPLRKMVRFAADGIVGFSTYPLKLIRSVGFAIATLAFLGVLYAVAVRVFLPDTAVPGWAFIVISVLFVGGIQLVMLGVLGSYIGRIYTEAQDRPLYMVSHIYTHEK